MSREWTPQQIEVINTRDTNILVSAAAGSGKTAVLVERIVALISDEENPIDIDSIVVVTFTRAAAAEMRERILARIVEQLEKNPDNKHLLRQSTLVHNAFISTIDSFCSYIVKNYYYELDLDPNYRMGTEVELKQLGAKVLSEMIEERYASAIEAKDANFFALVETYCNERSDKGLEDAITSLSEKSDSSKWPQKWLESLLEPYKVESVEDIVNQQWFTAMIKRLREELAGIEADLKPLFDACRVDGGPAYIIEFLERDKSLCCETLSIEDDFEFYNAISRLEIETKIKNNNEKRSGCGCSKEAAADVISRRAEMIKMLAQDIELFCPTSLEEQLEILKYQSPIFSELIELVKEYRKRLLAQKKKKGVFGFGDIEHFALGILVDEETDEPTKVALAFQKQFAEIMIDEYQDSNYIQEAILTSIAKENNMFMVGDVKQSIYAFRQACPELFIDKYQRYKDGNGGKLISLPKNFRSRSQVLNSTNTIFSRLMHKDLGGVEYDNDARLDYGASATYDSNPGEEGDFSTEIILVDTDKDGLDGGDFKDKIAFETKVIADKIKYLMRELKVVDSATKQLRELSYSDIAILNSKLTDGDEIIKILQENGVPAYTQSKKGFFETLEVKTVLNYLSVIDNPLQDIPLAAVLRSPIVGLKDDELALLRRPGSLYKNLLDCSEDFAAKQAIENFLNKLDFYRGIAPEVSIYQLLQMILQDTGYLAYATALPRGAQRRANLLRLVEEAVDFERSGIGGLFNFVRYIEQCKKYKEDMGEVSMVNGADDVVTLTTIHGSKGLEYPVVFVMGLGRNFNRDEIKEPILLHSSLGMASKNIHAEEQFTGVNLYHSVIKDAMTMDQDGEEMRLLYVAMTRAKEKLIMVAGLDGKPSKEGRSPLMERVKEWNVSGRELTLAIRKNPPCFMKWIIAATASDRGDYPLNDIYPEEVLVTELGSLIEHDERRREITKKIKDAAKDEEAISELKKHMSYQYPYALKQPLKNKYSVSEIKHYFMDRILLENNDDEDEQVEFEPKAVEKNATIPKFISGESEDAKVNEGAKKGTATHRFLECYDFTKEPSKDEMKAQLDAMISSGKLSKEDAKRLSWNKIYAFLASDEARRMGRAALAGRLFVEQPFVMSETPDKIFPEREVEAADEPVLVQGIIDVFWIEEDGIVLLDYKTDRVAAEQELIDCYDAQLTLYASALARSFDLPVKLKIIYSLALEKAIMLQ